MEGNVPDLVAIDGSGRPGNMRSAWIASASSRSTAVTPIPAPARTWVDGTPTAIWSVVFRPASTGRHDEGRPPR